MHVELARCTWIHKSIYLKGKMLLQKFEPFLGKDINLVE